MKKILIVFIICILYACGSDNNNDTASTPYEKVINDTEALLPVNCSLEEQNRFIYDVMHTTYIWRDSVPVVNYKAYPSPVMLMDALMVDKDKYTNIVSKEYEQNFSENTFYGFGMINVIYDNNIYFVSVIPGSPADEAGIMRGNKLISIDGINADVIADYDELNKRLKPETIILSFLNSSGQPETVTMTKTRFHRPDVSFLSVFTDKDTGKKTGYFFYESFVNITEDLKKAVKDLSDAKIDYLILDFRFNSGGKTGTFQYLASAFAGRKNIGKVMYTQEYYGDYGKESFKFTDTGTDIDVSNIAVIVSESTASASELMISALKPYKNVTVIGSKTYGKPVGGVFIEFCGQYFIPTLFKVLNSEGYGDYYDGIQPDCHIEDNYTNMKPFTDEKEQMTAASLYYFKNGVCPQQ